MTLKSRISVHVLDETGTLEVDHSGTPVAGAWPAPSYEIVPNNPITLRMQMEPTDTEFVEVSGLVVCDRVTDFEPGAQFLVDVLRISRSARSKVPDLPDGFDELPTLALPQSPIGQRVRGLSEFESKTVPRITQIPTMASPSKSKEQAPLISQDEDDDADTILADNLLLDSSLFSEFSSEQETTHPGKKGRLVIDSRSIDDAQTPMEHPNRSVSTAKNSGPLAISEEDPSLEEPTGIVGTLKEMPLPDLIQSLELARKTAQLVISPRTGEPGSVFIESGRVVWAECGNFMGEDAFYQLARSTRGSFRMRFHVSAPGKNIHSATQFLLLEALRRVDEGRNSGNIAMESAEADREKEALPSARDAVDAARKRARRKKRKRAKGRTKKQNKESAKPEAAKAPVAAQEAPDSTTKPIKTATKRSSAEAATPIAAADKSPKSPDADENHQTPPPPKKGSLFSSFFEEASESGDDVKSALD